MIKTGCRRWSKQVAVDPLCSATCGHRQSMDTAIALCLLAQGAPISSWMWLLNWQPISKTSAILPSDSCSCFLWDWFLQTQYNGWLRARPLDSFKLVSSSAEFAPAIRSIGFVCNYKSDISIEVLSQPVVAQTMQESSPQGALLNPVGHIVTVIAWALEVSDLQTKRVNDQNMAFRDIFLYCLFFRISLNIFV